jgi:hypothetical protein
MREIKTEVELAATLRLSQPIFELLAQSRVESAYFVVARRGKNASARSPQHGGARFSDARRWAGS